MEAGREENSRKVDDFRDPRQNHAWLAAISPTTDVVLPQGKWVALIGCGEVAHYSVWVGVGGHLCGYCGKHVVDKQGNHAMCCAGGSSTKGYDRLRDTLLAGFAASDPGADNAAENLIPSAPSLRLADMPTTAGHAAALAAVGRGS